MSTTVQYTGVERYSPITARDILSVEIAFRLAIDAHRKSYLRWFDIKVQYWNNVELKEVWCPLTQTMIPRNLTEAWSVEGGSVREFYSHLEDMFSSAAAWAEYQTVRVDLDRRSPYDDGGYKGKGVLVMRDGPVEYAPEGIMETIQSALDEGRTFGGGYQSYDDWGNPTPNSVRWDWTAHLPDTDTIRE